MLTIRGVSTPYIPNNNSHCCTNVQKLVPAMFSLSPKTLSSPPFRLHKTLNRLPPESRPRNAVAYNSRCENERGLEFETGGIFFRHESATGRDLGVLAAALYKKSNGSLRVLDALCGCGIRSLRYLAQAKADFVLANDANEEYKSVISSNLSRVSSGLGEEGKWEVTSSLANRLMAEKFLERDCFDLIDVDSFGSDSSFIRPAFDIVKLGGLLYLTSTDGHTSGGHRPRRSLASYGAFLRAVPYANEMGLRTLIGGAVREASVLGYHVSPIFSYYSYHGPVFRVLLRVTRGQLPEGIDYRFIGYCNSCGHSQGISWGKLGEVKCPCNANVPGSLIVSGPLWTGPLHCANYLAEMLNLAGEWGWTGNGMRNDLEKVLLTMIDESDPNLPFGYIPLVEIASRAKLNSPPIKTMMSTMQKEGYAASRSHIAPNAIKTNCPMADCIRIMKELQPR